MNRPSKDPDDWEAQRMKIIGLGELSIRKSYYPELQQKIAELERKNEELVAANEELQATEAELRNQYEELQKSEFVLDLARRKLNLLNEVTFKDIQNAIFILSGYLELAKTEQSIGQSNRFIDEQILIGKKIEQILDFAKNYQDMGIKPPIWHDVNQVFIFAISHLDLFTLSRTIILDNLEIYADSLLEQVFYNLMDNLLKHGKGATSFSLKYEKSREGEIILSLEDDGPGIRDEFKEAIFERGYGDRKGMGLFLVREILSVTGISIKETGTFGKGARFEFLVPKGAFRFRNNKL